MKKICHRTMGCEKKENCIEGACTAWGVISFIASDEAHMGGEGLPVAEMVISEPVYGCRDVE